MVSRQQRMWSPDEENLLKALAESGKSYAECTEELNRAGYDRRPQQVARKIENEMWRRKITVSKFGKHLDQISAYADKALIIADVHAPYHDADFMNELIDVALSFGCTLCGVAGDLIDMAAFWVYGKSPGIEFSDEIESTKNILSTLASSFKTVICVGGNHEERIARMLEFRADLDDLHDLWTHGSHVQYSPYHWFSLTSGGHKFQVEHPKNTSIHATLIPKKLAEKHGCNIIAGHGHSWGMTRDISDRYWAIDSGVACDPKRLAYVNIVHNTRPEMMQGGVLVIDGMPILLGPENIKLYKRMRIT